MSQRPDDPTAVESLLAERDALHGWLARLDEAGSTVPLAVRAKVRSDYERRMMEVTDRLGSHGDAIDDRLYEDREEFARLSQQSTSARDALAEAELRHAVGEYDSGRFEAEHSRHLADLEAYELSLGAVAERIERLEEIQALVSRAPHAESASVAPDAIDEARDSTSAMWHGGSGPSSVHPTADVDNEPIGMDELAPPNDGETDALLAIFDAEVAPPREPMPPSGIGPLSFTPSGAAEPPARPAVPPSAPPIGMPRAEPPRFVRPPVGVPESMVPQPPTEPAEDATAPAAVAADLANRTVRCVECGAMNRPNEWYCEKCGAELTAV